MHVDLNSGPSLTALRKRLEAYRNELAILEEEQRKEETWQADLSSSFS